MTATKHGRRRLAERSQAAPPLPNSRWLVFAPTAVFACMATSAAQAEALVLVRLRYAHKPYLSWHLDAKRPSEGQWQRVRAQCRHAPLKVTRDNRDKVRICERIIIRQVNRLKE